MAMRINGHAHIFNLQTVLTEEAIAIIVGRLRRNGYADFILDAVQALLEEQLLRPEYLSEDELLRRFLAKIAGSAPFRSLLQSGGSLPVQISLLGTGVESLTIDTLKAALDSLSTAFDPKGGVGKGIFNLFETLRLAMRSDIVGVADALLDQLQPDDALVALMMDIVAKPEKPRDTANFKAQLAGTAAAALARPGRILPFVAVNPNRPDHFDVMCRAIEESGFLGVKLYPSLGYEVTTDAMLEVLGYCEREEVPVLVHSSAGGFYKSAATAQYSHPKHWEQLVGAHPDLRVCFAHCGGWGGFSGQVAEHRPWWEAIVALMDAYPNIYADLAYHVDMMASASSESPYFAELEALLAHPVRGTRMIFGTDSWLVRMAITENAYWRYFETKLTPARFAQIAEAAPMRFLGLPVNDTDQPRRNVRRHVDWLAARADRVGAEPTAWVRKLTDAAFAPVRGNPRWLQNNRANQFFHHFFRYEVKQIPSTYHAGGFEEFGKLRLRQLAYWTKGHEPDAMFEQRCRGNAAKLDQFFTSNGARYEGSYDSATAIEKLREIFRDGERLVPDAGAAVDAIYLFATELQ